MRKSFVSILFTIVCMLCSFGANAYDFVVGGFFYNKIDDSRVEVTYQGETADRYEEYYGPEIVPSSVTYDGSTYRVSRIGNSAFSGCYRLDSVELPSTIVEIGENAFAGCSRMTTINIPSSVTTIGNGAFVSCSSMISINIPSSVTEIGENTFLGCTSLKEVTLSSYLESIGDKAFRECSALEKIVIPERVKTIGSYAFYKCGSLKDVTISNNVTSIGSVAFYECKALKSIVIPDKVTELNSSIFAGCESLTTVTIGKGCKNIGYRAFYNCTSLAEFTIPDGVTTIGQDAFFGCSGLTEITIPTSVTEMGSFFGCTALKNVYISDLTAWCKIDVDFYSPLYYATNLYLNGELIKNLVLPEGLTTCNVVFKSFKGVTSLTLPSTLTELPSRAFEDCTSLSSIISKATTPPTIDSSTFDEKVKSIPVIVPNGCKASYQASDVWKDFKGIIEEGESLPNDTKIEVDGICYIITNNVERTVSVTYSLSEDGYKGKRSIVIPESVIYGGFTYQVTGIGKAAFSDCIALTNITIPNSVTSIEETAFRDCTALTNITIPNSVTSIERSAFYGCTALKEVTIPNSITSIGDYAFAYNTKLTNFYSNAIEPPLVGEGSFKSVSGMTVHVPKSCGDDYKNNVGWNTFEIVDDLYLDNIKTANPVITVNKRNITMACESKNSVIYYTLNGSTPVVGQSSKYTKPFGVTKNSVIKAIAVCEYCAESEVVTAEATGLVNLSFSLSNDKQIYNGNCYSPKIEINGSMDSISARNYVSAYRLNVVTNENEKVSLDSLINEGHYQLVLRVINDTVYANSNLFLSIDRAPLSIVVDDVNRLYGSENPPLVCKYEGFVNGETEDVLSVLPTLSTEATITDAVGTYPITVSGAEAANYEISYQEGVLSITPAPLTITAEDKYIENGDELPEFTMVAEGFRNNDTITDIDVLPTFECDIEATTESGNYPIVLVGGSDNNYELTLVNGTLTVGERIILVESLTLSKDVLKMGMGMQEQLDAIIVPEDASNKGLLWRSSNNDVVTVDNGLVTVVGAGEAYVYATTVDGSDITAQCHVEVLSSGIAGVATDNIKIDVENRKVVVRNAPQGSVVALYNPSGMMLTSKVVKNETTSIAVEHAGIYIVKIDNVVRRVVLK